MASRHERRVLFISDSRPIPPTRGGNQRTNLLLRALQRIAETDFIYIHRDLESLPPEAEQILRSDFALRKIVRPWGGPTGSAIHRFLWKVRGFLRVSAARLGLPASRLAEDSGIRCEVSRSLDSTKYDLVVVRYLSAAAASLPFGSVPVLVDADDLEISHLEATLRAPGMGRLRRALARVALPLTKRAVFRIIDRCGHVWVTNESDRLRIGSGRATVLPNIPFDPPSFVPPPARGGSEILLVASLRYEVNRQAVSHFIRRIWPRIHGCRPAATVRIVGAEMGPKLRADWDQVAGVDCVGFVEDLATEYERCLFAVAPIFHGGGTKIKVLEALAHRRACVTTRHVQEAFGNTLRPDLALAVGDTPDDFASECVRLLDNPETARSMAEVGFETVRSKFSFARFARIVRRTVDELTPP